MTKSPARQALDTLGCTARMARLWTVMDGRNLTVVIGKLKREQVSFNFGKNVRLALATHGFDPTKLTGEELQAFVLKCQLAERISHNRGHKYIHNSGYVQAFEGAKGRAVQAASAEVVAGRNKRVRARKILASS